MSLLRDIQNDAVNSSVNVSDLLRKCKILAYRLGNEDFKSWVEFELNGYNSEDLLPDYRILVVGSKGYFVGRYGKSLSNADIPTHDLPDWLKETCTKAKFCSPIATLESYTVNDKNGHLTQSWDPVILVNYGSKMYSDLNCIQAHKLIPVASVRGIIDTVKTKILNFVLEIEALNPEAGEADLNSSPISQEKLTQIFNINITGNVQNLASGNHQSTVNQNISNNASQEFLELLNELKKSSLDELIAEEVAKKIEALSASVGTNEYKTLYGELMSFASNHVTVLGFLASYIPMMISYIN